MRLGYMFSGQGSQFPGMGRDLYDSSAAARRVFEEAGDVLHRSMASLCFDGTAEELTSCANCQPAIYTMSHACLAAFQERFPEAKPAVCGGLSLGEFSALSAAGVFSFADGLSLVARRGELMDVACREAEGGMAAVLGASPEAVAEICGRHGIDIANLNCPGQIVVSGRKASVEAAVSDCVAAGFKAVQLSVAGAYHSRLMCGAAEKFGECLGSVALSAPDCGVVQNVVGDAVCDVSAIRENLRRQVCSCVRWEDCVRRMMPQVDILLEFGPGKVLCGFMKRIDRGFRNAAVNGADALLQLALGD